MSNKCDDSGWSSKRVVSPEIFIFKRNAAKAFNLFTWIAMYILHVKMDKDQNSNKEIFELSVLGKC